MNVSIVAGDRRVDISVEADVTKLSKVEAVAARLFAATATPPEPAKPYGFALPTEPPSAAA